MRQPVPRGNERERGAAPVERPRPDLHHPGDFPDAPVLALAAVERRYGAVRALAGVDLEIRAGARHAIVGANGAGKSTCLRILCGADAPDAGEVRLDGRRVAWRSPHDARRAGVVMVPQETRLVPGLTVAENVVLGREPLVGRSPFVDRRAARRLAREALS